MHIIFLKILGLNQINCAPDLPGGQRDHVVLSKDEQTCLTGTEALPSPPQPETEVGAC